MENLQQCIDDGKRVALLKTQKSLPRHVHRVSDVGHPCHRYLYYAITDWEKATEPDVSLLGIFRLGHRIEQQVVDFFNADVGPACTPKLRIMRQGSPTCDKLLREHNISGTSDGVLCYEEEEGRFIPLGVIDIKSCAHSSFLQYSNLESMKRHTWSSLYPAQVQLYSFADNFDKGYLFFVSKQNIFYDWKLIEVPVDFQYIENILQKCKSVNEHIEAKIEPNRLNQPFWCKGCRFESICLPELVATGEGPAINESKEIDSLVNRVQELKPFAKEYTDLYEMLKSKLIRGQTLLTDGYMLDWKEVTVHRNAQPASDSTQWRLKMTSLSKDDDE